MLASVWQSGAGRGVGLAVALLFVAARGLYRSGRRRRSRPGESNPRRRAPGPWGPLRGGRGRWRRRSSDPRRRRAKPSPSETRRGSGARREGEPPGRPSERAPRARTRSLAPSQGSLGARGPAVDARAGARRAGSRAPALEGELLDREPQPLGRLGLELRRGGVDGLPGVEAVADRRRAAASDAARRGRARDRAGCGSLDRAVDRPRGEPDPRRRERDHAPSLPGTLRRRGEDRLRHLAGERPRSGPGLLGGRRVVVRRVRSHRAARRGGVSR